MNTHGEPRVADSVVYQQALDTVRSTGNQVVTTASALATICGVIVGFAVERDSPELLAVATGFPLAIEFLFRRWRRLDDSLLSVAADLENAAGRRSLAGTLQTNSQHRGWFIRSAPIAAAVALATWSAVWWGV